MVRVSGCSGPRTRSSKNSSAASWSRAPAASPARPVQSARLPRAVRVSGCSGPRTRSSKGSSAANWSRAPPDPPPARSRWRACAGWSGCPGARGRGPALEGQQPGVLVAAPPPHPPPARSVRRGCARCGQGVRVLGAEDPLLVGQQPRCTSRAPPGSPACPVQAAMLPRVNRVLGWSGPRTRSWSGSSAA